MRDVFGLIPAAGRATRLEPIPCSKEILPLGFGPSEDGSEPGPRVACEYLLESMRLAGVERVFVVLRDGKWDIPAFLGDGRRAGLSLAYLMMGLPHGVPFTLDQAFPFVRGARVACGFPDILTDPQDIFSPLLRCMEASESDVALALFPADDPERTDMVEVGEEGKVLRVQVKPGPQVLDSGWLAAAWGPAFTEFLHEYVARAAERFRAEGRLPREPHLGDVVQAAIERGLDVRGVPFEDGSFLDVGSPSRLLEAWRRGVGGPGPVSAGGQWVDPREGR